MVWDTRMKHARVCAAFAATMVLSTALLMVPSQAQDAPAQDAPAQDAPAKPTAAKGAAKTAVPVTPAAAVAAKKQKETEAAKRAYDAGIKSYQAGKFEPAVQSLSAALRGGGLSSQEMARGLYYRGLAYKKQSKPGLAISDLTSALWLKNGLNDADRQSATAERAEAYKSAGLGDGNSGTESVAVADPNAKQQAVATPAAATPAPAAAAPVPVPVTAASKTPAANDSVIPNRFAVSEGAPPPVPRQAANAPSQGTSGVAAGAAKSTGGSFNQAAALEQPRVEPTAAPVVQDAAAAATAAPIPASIPEQAAASSPNNTVGGFFSSLFGGGSEAPGEPAPVTTSSTDQSTVATSSWTDTTPVATGAKTKVAPAVKVPPPITTAAVAPGPVAQKAVAPAPSQIKGGKYKLHIAAMRSRPEAEALAQKLAQQYGNQLAARAPTVDEAVIGSMGTFYRVRVGSYATADEPRGLCNTLRNSGYDCLVVTN